MKNSFLEYYKFILEKVSFDRVLFNKEYIKALRTLHTDEIAKLKEWIREQPFYGTARKGVKVS